MNGFQQMMAEDLAGVLMDSEGPAMEAIFQPLDGDSKPCRVVMSRRSDSDEPFRDGESRVSTATITAPRAEIRALTPGDRFAVEALENPKEQDVWTVREILGQTPAYIRVRVVRSRRTVLIDEQQRYDRNKGKGQ